MKQFILILLLIICTTSLWAQSGEGVKSSGIIQITDDIRYCLPETAVWVDVQVTETRTVAGKYARYAQKLLGLTVPVVDKSQWKISDIKLNYNLCEFSTEVEPLAKSESSYQSGSSTLLDKNGFALLGIDRMSSEIATAEQMAHNAAEKIFEIRRCRFDLITGELGENVFGEGLSSALAELQTMENSLLEMFVGKRIINNSTIRYVIDAARKSSIICRFSETDGVLSNEDLSGNPLIIKFSPIQTDSLPAVAEPYKGPIEKFAIATKMRTTVSLDKTIYAERIIPVFQQGYTVVEKPKLAK